MAITESLNQNRDKIFCLIRRTFVSKTPEELVRQKVLQYMIQSLGYPESGFVVEQSLHGMPHLKTKSKTYFPDRRADILFFSRGIHPEHDLYPLILIECKAVKLTPKVINQVTSYNFYLQSLAVAIANEQEIKMGWLGENGYQFQEGLASYSQMKSFLAYR